MGGRRGRDRGRGGGGAGRAPAQAPGCLNSPAEHTLSGQRSCPCKHARKQTPNYACRCQTPVRRFATLVVTPRSVSSAFLLRICHYSQSPCQLPTGTRLQQPHGVGGWRGCARSRRVALVPPGVHVKRGRTLEVSARRALRTRRCAAGAGALVDRAAVVVNATAYRIPWSDIRVSRGRMCGVRIRYCHLRHINART